MMMRIILLMIRAENSKYKIDLASDLEEAHRDDLNLVKKRKLFANF